MYFHGASVVQFCHTVNYFLLKYNIRGHRKCTSYTINSSRRIPNTVRGSYFWFFVFLFEQVVKKPGTTRHSIRKKMYVVTSRITHALTRTHVYNITFKISDFLYSVHNNRPRIFIIIFFFQSNQCRDTNELIELLRRSRKSFFMCTQR